MSYILILAAVAVILVIKLFSLFGQKKYIRKERFSYKSGKSGWFTSPKASKTAPIKDVELKLEKITEPINRLKILSPAFEMKKF